jgi:predicted acetyltransferase
MQFRDYDPSKDKDAVHRLLREVGWMEKGKEDLWDAYLSACRVLVADLDAAAECLVGTIPGVIRYLDHDLPMLEVTLVATSHIARRQRLASTLLARALALGAADGALVSRVCVFDQGFYNRAGFGTGGYEHTLLFDPSALKVDVEPRVPRRLTRDDHGLMHASRLARLRGHGAANYLSPAVTELEVRWPDKGFGLGYCDGPNGELTHHFWCDADNFEHGPYNIRWLTYQTREQFLELMALIKSLRDQVHAVRMREPQGIQLQDLLDRPFRRYQITEKSRFENRMSAYAFWQIRVLDLPACLAHTRLPAGETRFNLHLTDPVEDLLDQEAPWRGAAGDYLVTLGTASAAESGSDPSLPTLTASVNSFSRLWFGIRPATGLAVTDDLSGPPALLRDLDLTLRLPDPKPDWDF